MHKRLPNVPGAVSALGWLLIAVVPVYYVVITSLKTQANFFDGNPMLPPDSPTLDSYRLVLDSGFGTYFRNSVVVTIGTVVIAVAVALLASYAIVRSGRRRWARWTFAMFLLGLAIPLQAVIIPIYFMITRMHMYDTLVALVLPSVAFAIPLTVVILVNFLRDVPNELYDSMRVDGAGHAAILWSLVVPLSRPALTTVAIYNGLTVWNGFLFPLILTQSSDKRVLPLALWTFQGQFSINVHAVLAAVVLSTLPILALYIVGRRQLLAGLTAGFGR